MPDFNNLVLPNMDIVCSYEFKASSTSYPATSTCSNPILYQISYLTDIIFICVIIFTGIKIILWQR